MMEHWQACFIVLLVDLAFGRDIPVNTKYVIKQIDSCPDVGYYFRRELSPNAVDPGPCYLCFCQNNGTAACWERDQRRCDVEKFHHHRVGRQSRSRRSPTGLADIFFRDATRDLFNVNSPEECKPFEASYSDGCPPVDWCIGCTVCDCDANGRWDCHILSFCDGKEKKKKIKPARRSGSRRAGRSWAKKGPSKPSIRTTTKRTKRNGKKTSQGKTQNKPQNKTQNKPQNKTENKPKYVAKKATKKPVIKQQPKKIKKLLPAKKTQLKRPKQKLPKSNVSKVKVVNKNEPKLDVTKAKIIKKAAGKPLTLQRTNLEKLINTSNNNETVKLGEKIVKQIMTTVQKVLTREMNKINATRVQRSLLGEKGCSRAKKIDKTTYNVKSNAEFKNKSKFKRQTSSMINYTSTGRRHKREILNDSQAKINNLTVIVLHQDNNTVIPLETKNNIEQSRNYVISDVTLAPTFTPQQGNYYKYFIRTSMKGTTTSSTTKLIRNATGRNNSDNLPNFVVPLETFNNASSNSVEHKIDNKIIDIGDPEINDLKFTKWFIVKVDKNKETKMIKRLSPKPRIQLGDIGSTDQTYIDNKKTQNNDVKAGVTKRQNINNPATRKYNILKRYSNNPPLQNKTDVTGLQNVLQNLIKEMNRNNTKVINPRSKISVMKYVKKFFHKLFSKKKATADKVYGIGFKEDHTLQILCENIGQCNINRSNKFILKLKLKQLNEETASILQSIRIIKGLLHLLDLPYNNNDVNVPSNPRSFQTDVQKLSTILKDSYNVEAITTLLTDTQLTQINYIKKNTQTFIESVKKFAEILNEIILIAKVNTENDRYGRPLQKKMNDTVLLHKIKKMLNTYNIIQNTFMRKIYEMVNGFEKKTTFTKSCTTTTENHVVGSKNNNNDKVIETYSKNIIRNLNRLKNLAQALSPKRTKRGLYVRDNALEYLLTLMEYLIKQNHPLNTAPANDGIDFLIDAIKNAPDIKTNRKTVLSYATAVKVNDTDLSDLIEETNSDSNRISKEINNSDSNRISQETNQNLQENNIININRRMEQTTEVVENVTQKVYYKKYENHQTLIEDAFETTSDSNDLNKKRSNDDLGKSGFEKFESNIDDMKKYDVYASEVEDETVGDGSDNTGVVNSTSPIKQTAEQITLKINVEEVSITTSKQDIITATNKHSSSESQDVASDTKTSKLDWIEATFDKEIKEFSETNVSHPIQRPTLTTPPLKKTTSKITENISGLSAETGNEGTGSRKKSLQNSKGDDVMNKKEADFLNSLDYGAEKSDFDGLESNNEERSDDGSPAYFV